MNEKKLSIVLPIYNEEKSIKKTILEWKNELDLLKIDYEIILAEDGSDDNTKNILLELINDDKNFKRAYLVDLISIDKKNEILTSLIGVCINEAKKRKCDIFEFRGFNGSKLGNIKSFKPFEKKLSFNPFYYKSNNKKLNKILNKSSHWSPSYIDGDVIVNF